MLNKAIVEFFKRQQMNEHENMYHQFSATNPQYAVDRKFSGRFDIQTIFNEILVVH